MALTKTPVMVLQELATKKKWPPPEFHITYQVTGTHTTRFDFEVNLSAVNVIGRGSGSSKQIGKHEAAHSALKQLEEKGIYIPAENPAKFEVAVKDINSPFKSSINCIMDLQNLCLEKKIPPPLFQEISSVGPPHAKEFAWECKVASIRTEAKANTKKMAKQMAAKEMLERIIDVLPEMAAQVKEEANTITEQDNEAVKKYNSEFSKNVIPDKSSRVNEMPDMFIKLMNEKGLKYADFSKLFLDASEENLSSILDKLDLKYEMTVIQEMPPIVTVELNTERPFCTASLGRTLKEAKTKVFNQIFFILQCFMSKGLEDGTETESDAERTKNDLESMNLLSDSGSTSDGQSSKHSSKSG